MRKPNYDKYPATAVEGRVRVGWESIAEALCGGLTTVLAVDCYTGVFEDEVVTALAPYFSSIVHTKDLMKSETEVRAMTDRFMTDDVLFGYVANIKLEEFFDAAKLADARQKYAAAGKETLIIGIGASLVAPAGACLVYADMARWEIQQRFRRHEVCGIGVDNRSDAVSVQYKRGLFIDWRTLDAYKETLFNKIEWWLDTNDAARPKLITGETFCNGLAKMARMPFRLVPFFDPAPWGGQWMKEVCDLDRSMDNYGGCFD